MDPAHRRTQGLEVEDVAGDDCRRVAVRGDGLWAAGQAAHSLPALLERSEEPAADVAGGAGDEGALSRNVGGVGVHRCLLKPHAAATGARTA